MLLTSVVEVVVALVVAMDSRWFFSFCKNASRDDDASDFVVDVVTVVAGSIVLRCFAIFAKKAKRAGDGVAVGVVVVSTFVVISR